MRVRDYLIGVVIAGFVVGLVWWLNHSNTSSGTPDGTPAPLGSAAPKAAAPDRLILDDSGYPISREYVFPLRNPDSLEHIRDCSQGAGMRGIQLLERELAQSYLHPDVRFEKTFKQVQLHLFEGQALQASEVLARFRKDTDSKRYPQQHATIVFLQGVAALRRGETENCVECQCHGSCVLPIRPAAFHTKGEGSREAIRYFTEYLRDHAHDDGVRWLLNLCYMTIGEYPDKVPLEYVIPPKSFESEMDLGKFRDIAPQLGLNRFNQAGGAIFEDFDNDGLLDLVVTCWDPGATMQFYRNKGDGTFEERSQLAGLKKQLGGLYCVQTDYNNDGFKDIYIARGAWTGMPQRHSLLRNNGDGTFTDVTVEAGLDAPADGQVAQWADYDNDGFLDLFVGAETTRCRLYHNRGNGKFEEVASQAGVTNNRYTKGANWGDFDGDGYPDLYVSNLHVQNASGENRLYRNNRDGTFTDVALALGVALPLRSFACWFWDYDNDGWLDIWVNTFEVNLNDLVRSELKKPHSGQTCRLYRNLEGKGFKDVSVEAGVNLSLCPMGSNFGDIDNDGFLDMYLGTGNPNYSALVPKKLLKNLEGKRFADITYSSGTGHLQKGHAVCFADWANRGYEDIFIELGGATPGDTFRNALWHNPCQGNHSIKVKLVGKKTNHAALGARIKVVPGEGGPREVHRHVTSGSSFGANPLPQHIGVGKATKIARLEVYWPTSKTTQVFTNLDADQSLEITEFSETYRQLEQKRLPVPD